MNFNIIEVLGLVASVGFVSFISAVLTIKYDIIKIKAGSSQEVSKADQEKIATADKALELVNKLQDSMDKKFEEMSGEIVILKEVVKDYKLTCDSCDFRKTKKQGR
jgi:hypothetical protein